MLIKEGLGDGKIKWEIENGKLLILSFNFMFIMRNTIFCSLSFIIDIHAFFPEGSETTSKGRKKLMTAKEVMHYT